MVMVASPPAVAALPFLACLCGPSRTRGWVNGVAVGLGLLLLCASLLMGAAVAGEFGDERLWVHPLFGIAVFRIAMVAHLVSAARFGWLMSDNLLRDSQPA
jgi:hypothetical protein